MRAAITILAITGTALLISGCGDKEAGNVAGATEVQVENETTSDAMVTSINAATPIDNFSETAPSNASGSNATAPKTPKPKPAKSKPAASDAPVDAL